jgi:hypothetical protein
VVLHDGYGRCRTAWCEVPGGGGGGFRLACSRGPRLIGIGFGGGGQGQALYCGGSVVSIRRERVRDLIWTPDGDVFAVRARARMRDD